MEDMLRRGKSKTAYLSDPPPSASCWDRRVLDAISSTRPLGLSLGVFGAALDLVSFRPLHQASIIIHQHLRLRHDPPLDPPEELQLQQRQFFEAHPSDPGVGVVGPERVAQSFARDRGAGDQESMDRQG